MSKPGFATSGTASLARRLGIELDYLNAARRRVDIAPEVIRAVLAAMGYPVRDDTEGDTVLGQLDATEHSHKLPPVLVVRHDRQPVQIPVRLNGDSRKYNWRLVSENGEIMAHGPLVAESSARVGSQASNDCAETAWANVSTEIPCGYHRFELDGESMPLIVVPAKCWLGPVGEGRRTWGIAAQLYLLRSERNWGIGDFTDLCTLIDIAAEWGASVVGLNPLHALFLDQPEHASPYAPASRLFLNILNIDIAAIPEFAACREANSLVTNSDFAAVLGRVRDEKMVNYSAVAELKLKTLRLLHSYFKMNADGDRKRSCETFADRGGESLKCFCAFQAARLARRTQAGTAEDVEQLPQELRSPDSPEFLRILASCQDEVDFQVWAQWIADSQLQEAARHAEANGIRLGLYRDLAVGSSAAGAEAWSNPHVVAGQARAGAPPDIVNPAGQDWGLPPFNPRALRQAGYAPFIELVQANMRYSGALRIDHVVGLQHLYWVPVGQNASRGAYVSYPFDDLVGIIALESQRNHCVVIGEDLGTVPPGFSEKLNARGILSNRVLYFEQDPESGEFLPPHEYVQLALASIGSHDLATLKGWWLGNDIAIREQHRLYPDPLEGKRQRETRREQKQQLLKALTLEDLDPGDGDDFQRLSRAVHAFLGRSRSAITMVEMENLTDELSQTNLPATSTEHPNWRRRYSMSLEQLSKNDRVTDIIEAIQQERPRPEH
jgi:4-alpha-glucanotransferase